MKKHPTDTDLDFLRKCTKEELDFLVRVILDANPRNHLQHTSSFKMHPDDPTQYVDEIIAEIQWDANPLAKNHWHGYGVSYRKALYNVLEDLQAGFDRRLPLPELENLLLRYGLPYFLDHIRDGDMRAKFSAILENPGGTSMSGDIDFLDWKKFFHDVLPAMGVFFAPATGVQYIVWYFRKQTSNRVVLPSVLYIAALRKKKNQQAKGY